MIPDLILKLSTLSIKCLTCYDTVTEKREQKRERTLFLVSKFFILNQKFELLAEDAPVFATITFNA